jgi:hypothetical protein
LGIFGKSRGTGFKIWIFPRFSRGEQVSKSGFFCGFLQFLRGWAHPKNLKTWIIPQFLGSLRDGLTHIFFETQIFPQFCWDFEGTDPPKELANP